jgi:hypothetical protein
MPFCPKCETEYRAGFNTCANCGEQLVEQLPPPPEIPIDNEPLVAIYYAPEKLRAFAVKDALEAAGIPVVEQLGVSPMTYDGLDISVQGYYSRLLTFESRAPEAKRIVVDFLAAYERGDLALPEDSQPD